MFISGIFVLANLAEPSKNRHKNPTKTPPCPPNPPDCQKFSSKSLSRPALVSSLTRQKWKCHLVLHCAHIRDVDRPRSLSECLRIALVEPALHGPLPRDAQAHVQETNPPIDVTRIAPISRLHDLGNCVCESAVHQPLYHQVAAVLPQKINAIIASQSGLDLFRQVAKPVLFKTF